MHNSKLCQAQLRTRAWVPAKWCVAFVTAIVSSDPRTAIQIFTKSSPNAGQEIWTRDRISQSSDRFDWQPKLTLWIWYTFLSDSNPFHQVYEQGQCSELPWWPKLITDDFFPREFKDFSETNNFKNLHQKHFYSEHQSSWSLTIFEQKPSILIERRKGTEKDPF